MTTDPAERRIYNQEERTLIQRGKASEAKVCWHERYQRSTPAEQLAMVRSS